MPVATTGSTNIAVLDSRIIADLCAGKFYVDVSPSIYIADGAANVIGANVRITNPYNVVVKDYGPSFEIAPLLSGGMDAVVSFNIPTQANNYQYGKYRIDVQLFDGTNSWTVTKYVTLCPPDPKDKTKSFGSLSVMLNGSCKAGRLDVVVDNPPNYNGKVADSQVLSLKLEYPTSSGLGPLTTAVGAFSVLLFEGVYKATGEMCVTYNFDDNTFVKVKYKIKKEKNIRCLIDECCVFTELAALDKILKTNCTLEEKMKTTDTIFDALRLLKTIQLAADCGEDASDYINDLEDLLGCKCTCNCAEGTPIINNAPSSNISIQGCGWTKETVGLTDVYTFNNYEYIVDVVENGGALVVSAPSLTDCTKRQVLSFNIATVYAQIRSLANAADSEGDFWGAVVNRALRGMTSIQLACLGIDGSTWNGFTLKQKIEIMLTKMCGCCGCDGSVSNVDVSNSGSDVTVGFDVSANVYYADVYLDNIFKTRIFTGIVKSGLSYTFVGAADGTEHEYMILPVCGNNSNGTFASGTFAYLGCPDVAPPELTATNVNGVECPFDLTSLEVPPPTGISIEWHNNDNTSSASLISGTSALSGIYYAFAKNSDGCYSTGVKVTLICEAAVSCSAPQNLLVTKFGASGALIQFQSAAFPPPGNSYTVKRKAAADPDIDASYTTIGTPTWNSSTNRWQITDTISHNTLYTYKAQSNCADSPGSTPYMLYAYADIVCNTVQATPHANSIDYSLAITGYNEINKYEVKLYNSAGTVLIHTDTFLPSFSDPLTGTFTYLTAGTAYKIVVTAWIGTYSKTSCSTLNVSTTVSGNDSIIWSVNGVPGANLTITDSLTNEVLNVNSSGSPQNGTLTGLSGTYQICAQWVSGSGNTIQMRICDSSGNEVYFDNSILIGEGASCFVTVSLPASAAPYTVYVTAGNVTPPACIPLV